MAPPRCHDDEGDARSVESPPQRARSRSRGRGGMRSLSVSNVKRSLSRAGRRIVTAAVGAPECETAVKRQPRSVAELLGTAVSHQYAPPTKTVQAPPSDVSDAENKRSSKENLVKAAGGAHPSRQQEETRPTAANRGRGMLKKCLSSSNLRSLSQNVRPRQRSKSANGRRINNATKDSSSPEDEDEDSGKRAGKPVSVADLLDSVRQLPPIVTDENLPKEEYKSSPDSRPKLARTEQSWSNNQDGSNNNRNAVFGSIDDHSGGGEAEGAVRPARSNRGRGTLKKSLSSSNLRSSSQNTRPRRRSKSANGRRAPGESTEDSKSTSNKPVSAFELLGSARQLPPIASDPKEESKSPNSKATLSRTDELWSKIALLVDHTEKVDVSQLTEELFNRTSNDWMHLQNKALFTLEENAKFRKYVRSMDDENRKLRVALEHGAECTQQLVAAQEAQRSLQLQMQSTLTESSDRLAQQDVATGRVLQELHCLQLEQKQMREAFEATLGKHKELNNGMEDKHDAHARRLADFEQKINEMAVKGDGGACTIL